MRTQNSLLNSSVSIIFDGSRRTDVLIKALLASSAIPIFFPPVEITVTHSGSPETGWYIDGGVGNHTPTREAAYFSRYVKEKNLGHVGLVVCVKQDPPRLLRDTRQPLHRMLQLRSYDFLRLGHALASSGPSTMVQSCSPHGPISTFFGSAGSWGVEWHVLSDKRSEDRRVFISTARELTGNESLTRYHSSIASAASRVSPLYCSSTYSTNSSERSL